MVKLVLSTHVDTGQLQRRVCMASADQVESQVGNLLAHHVVIKFLILFYHNYYSNQNIATNAHTTVLYPTLLDPCTC